MSGVGAWDGAINRVSGSGLASAGFWGECLGWLRPFGFWLGVALGHSMSGFWSDNMKKFRPFGFWPEAALVIRLLRLVAPAIWLLASGVGAWGCSSHLVTGLGWLRLPGFCPEVAPTSWLKAGVAPIECRELLHTPLPNLNHSLI